MVAELLVISNSLTDGYFTDASKQWRTIEDIIIVLIKAAKEWRDMTFGEVEKVTDLQFRAGTAITSEITLWKLITEISVYGPAKALTMQQHRWISL